MESGFLTLFLKEVWNAAIDVKAVNNQASERIKYPAQGKKYQEGKNSLVFTLS